MTARAGEMYHGERRPANCALRRRIALLAVVGPAACLVTPTAGAAPGVVDAGGMHVVAVVDSNRVIPAGGDVSSGIPFLHAVKVSGNYSVTLSGVHSVRSGQIVAGYLIGCAVSVVNGVAIGIEPEAGVNAGISPAVTLNLTAPPGVSVGVQPSVGVNAGVQPTITVTLTPGTVTAAEVGTAGLDNNAQFPYTFGHTNTPLNISGCLSPVSAIPFVTVRADGVSATAQTTGYGAEFTF